MLLSVCFPQFCSLEETVKIAQAVHLLHISSTVFQSVGGIDILGLK